MMPKWVRLTLPAAALAVAACDAPTIPPEAGAYDFTFETDPPSVMRWPAGTTIRIYVAGGQDATRAVVLRDAFLEAAAKWESAVLFGEYRFAEAASLAEADVVLFWWGDSPPRGPGGLPARAHRGWTDVVVPGPGAASADPVPGERPAEPGAHGDVHPGLARGATGERQATGAP